MFHKVLLIGAIVCGLGMGVMFHHFSDASDLLHQYQKFGFIASDFRYEKVEKAWGNEGLIFYQISFPFVGVPIQADKMYVSVGDTGMKMHLKNAHLQVIEGLKRKYGATLEDGLSHYTPYQDFFTHLLTSMAVMGMDEWQGDIFFDTIYQTDKMMRFQGKMTQEKEMVLEMTATLEVPIVGAHQFSDFWTATVQSAQIQLQDSLLMGYVHYANSRQIPPPAGLGQGKLTTPEKSPIFSFKQALQ